jgi:hypothetical protein
MLRPNQVGLSVGLPEGTAGFGHGSDNAEAYQRASDAVDAGANFQLSTGNQVGTPASGFSMADIAAAGRDTGGGVRDKATDPNRRIAARDDSDVGDTRLRQPQSPNEQARIANLGKQATSEPDDRIRNLGINAAGTDSRIQNLGRHPQAPPDDRVKNLGNRPSPEPDERIKNLGVNAAGVDDRIKNLGVNKKSVDPDEEERIRKLGLGED